LFPGVLYVFGPHGDFQYALSGRHPARKFSLGLARFMGITQYYFAWLIGKVENMKPLVKKSNDLNSAIRQLAILVQQGVQTPL
jgi:hypothetical protein